MSLLQTIYNNDVNLYDKVKHFVDQGEDLNRITEYGESALRVASNNGRFDVVELLLNAGADSSQLEWTHTISEVVFGTPDSIKKAVQETGDLETTDFWSRTPFLFAIQLGDIEKASLLLELGANRKAVGRCGKTAMAYAIQHNNVSMLKWLVDQGFDTESANDFQDTPLITAASLGMSDCLKFLIDCGADIYKANKIPERAIQVATNMKVVRILVDCGDDINDISPEMHAELLGVEYDATPLVSKEAYIAGRYRQFGTSNAEATENPFWMAMIRSGASGWRASETFSDSGSEPEQAIWSYQRFGRSTTILGDGRIVEIAGEHEDYYDSDFCIYNDVTVFEKNGEIRIFSYPAELFPPTDFHTATLVGDFIYIIGSLGYPESRRPDHTPVYRLNIQSFEIDKVDTTGEIPGWISRHKAFLNGRGEIVLRGGRKIVLENDQEDYIDNTQRYQLCLKSFVWTRLKNEGI
ncbi:ankyrin repeat domain-containing protein [Paraherbaspirillum soli]|uniref:Ankyrin repeat domain-containing protein n=2 Tax=Paraherbaspirillum soli TaxID=631222 RepID=A0ABW0MAQ7_9BURK